MLRQPAHPPTAAPRAANPPPLSQALQRIQRKRLREQQERLGLAGSGGAAEEDGHEAPAAVGLGSAAGPAAAANGVGATGGSSGARLQQSSIQLSEQSSPERAGSACSTDDLLLRNDLEAGLLGRRTGRGGTGSSRGGRGAAAEPAVDRLESFVPRRPVEDSLQVGAGKTGEGPPGQPQRGDSKAGERGAVDAGACPCCALVCSACCPLSLCCWSAHTLRLLACMHAMTQGPFLHAHPRLHHRCMCAETIQEAAWAMKFAFASYGVLLYLFTHGPA